MQPTLADIQQAAERIKPYIKRTPLLTCSMLDDLSGAQLFFKCENFQKTGAYKFRGACNAVFSLSDEQAARGVATQSSGNHAAALALAAKIRGIPAYIVMPETATPIKKQAVASYGAKITFCSPGQEAREAMIRKVIAETGAEYIPPYDDVRIITGQGTIALELFAAQKDFDILVVPVGGGGLLAGISIATKELSPHTQVIAAEPEMANDAYQGFQRKQLVLSNNPQTICDGLLTSMSDLTFGIMLDNVTSVITASEKSILTALKLIWERMKIVVEPSSAVVLAIILDHPEIFKGKKVGVVISGGNVDFPAVVKLMYQ